MKCPNCGKEIANDSQFCEYCGVKIFESKNKSKVPWVVLCIILLFVLGIVLYIVPKGQKVACEEISPINTTDTVEVVQVSEYKKDVDNNAITIGETWSYTNKYSETTYFVFTSITNITWLFKTPFGNVFPVGFGKYDVWTGDVTFSSSDKLHKNISLYYGVQAIIFHIDRNKRTARCKLGEFWANEMYNQGNEFPISKEKRKLMPNKKLVGSTWKTDDGDCELYFKTMNEVVFHSSQGDSEPVAYVCIGDMIAIKSGDNISDENLIGEIVKGNEATLCREGLSSDRGSWCVSIYKQYNFYPVSR